LETLLWISIEVKILFFILRIYSIVVLVTWLWEFGEEMAEKASEGSGSFVVKNIQNLHHLNIDVVKFDGTNNFGLWRCEVLNALNAQNLEDSLELQEKPAKMEEDCKKIQRI